MQRTAAGIGQERAARLDALERASPEWRPWVELLRATFQADADLAPAPEPLTPDARPRTPADIAPLLHGRTVRLDAGRLRSLVQRLGELVDLRRVAELGVVALAAAAVRQDSAVLERAARQAEIEPAAFETVLNLAVWPLLQACGRQLQTHIPSGWSRGYCPVCGAWPVLAGLRGPRAWSRDLRRVSRGAPGRWRASGHAPQPARRLRTGDTGRPGGRRPWPGAGRSAPAPA